MNSKEIFTTHTFRLKRTKPREPLGLVLLSGEKTSDGRPKSFYVKEVHPDTLGWRAGVQAKDKIIQVDFHDLASINPQEAVARIKERPLVNITVLRGSNPRSRVRSLDFEAGDNHVYEEILYSDCNQSLSQGGASQGHSQGFLSQDDNGGGSMASGSHFSSSKNKPAKMEDRSQRLQNQQQQLSSSSLQLSYARERAIGGKPAKNPRERGSKDSGLSSGSSGHQDDADPSQGRHGFVGHPHTGDSSSLHNRLCRTGSGGSGSYQPEHCVSNIHCRIEGDYEVEDIYLQKNGTSQLGITLGYNTEVKTGGRLHVCEVVPNGLAAQNGRLRNGDIIRRVNGFEVHDPEEAILLFLEQDQDITLTVARLLKTKPGRIRGTPPRITTTPPRSFGSTPHTPTTGHFPSKDLGDHNYAVLETAAVSNSFRRVDSCGTLDSRKGVPSQQTQNRSPVFMHDNEPDNERMPSRTGYEKMRRTKSTGSSSSWSARRREQQVKSVSPPAVTRQPSPLVNHQQQQLQEEPTYQVLESSSSTYQVLEPSSSTYQVLEPSSPVYHVLQSPPANKSPPSYRNPPPPPFLDEPFELFSDNSTKVSSKAAMFTSSQQLPSSSVRPSSAGPQGRFRINSSSGREKFDTRNSHMHGSKHPNVRSIGKEIKPMRPDTVAADYRTESLV